MQILGVRVDAVTKREAIERTRSFLRSGGQHAIFTPNPEMLVKAHNDSYFRDVLNSGELNVCDGFGLWLAMRIKNLAYRQAGYEPCLPAGRLRIKNRIERIPGSDFMLEVCRLAAEEGRAVYLLGSGNEAIVKQAAENLQKQFPGLKIVGMNKGPVIGECQMSNVKCQIKSKAQNPNEPSNRVVIQPFNHSTIQPSNSLSGLEIDQEKNDNVIQEINSKQPDILFVAFGMGKQEKWIRENLSKLPSVTVAMGVGGAFDYISGKVARAPRVMRALGLEWVYRLVREPRRFKRIFNATVRFGWLVITKGVRSKE
jgi:N-acetylglucosaminyldiphosphoundecaprenol N-acetyl-beta-D-mannosaminyltransferase